MTFDQAFSLVKMFFEVATSYCVEDVQRFGNTYVPAPWWVRVVRVVVPPETCSDAGDLLIKMFGQDEIRGVVGGEQWWQRRGQKDGGVEGEWIAMKTDWKNVRTRDDVNHRRREGHRRKKAGGSKEEVERVKSARKEFNQAADEEKDRTKAARRAANKKKKQDPGSATTTTAGTDGDETAEETADEEEATLKMGPDKRSREEKEADESYHEDMDDMRCMLYIHGGVRPLPLAPAVIPLTGRHYAGLLLWLDQYASVHHLEVLSQDGRSRLRRPLPSSSSIPVRPSASLFSFAKSGR